LAGQAAGGVRNKRARSSHILRDLSDSSFRGGKFAVASECRSRLGIFAGRRPERLAIAQAPIFVAVLKPAFLLMFLRHFELLQILYKPNH
jgi:hypothetical protein